MTEIAPSLLAAALTLRVAEAHVEDIGRAIAVAPAEDSEEGHEGLIQIEGIVLNEDIT